MTRSEAGVSAHRHRGKGELASPSPAGWAAEPNGECGSTPLPMTPRKTSFHNASKCLGWFPLELFRGPRLASKLAALQVYSHSFVNLQHDLL